VLGAFFVLFQCHWVIILLVGGHEAWRRICPLYFISQIPRRLGSQRKQANPVTGSGRRAVAKVSPDSWLGRNFAYLQMFLLFLGLNLRLLVSNGSGVGCGCLILASITGALLVGYLFSGRSWCHYFCPMAPVQVFYTSNRGLLGSDAHLSPAKITQSMCRSIDNSGQEKSACVSCQSPCLDIDAERTYWENLERPDRQLLFYGYFGLMLGFYVYFYLYAGNWDYYFSGIWSHDPQQFSSLLQSGFYIGGRSIAIPKIIAAPLTLGVFTASSYWVGMAIEYLLGWWNQRQSKNWSKQQIRHICFVSAVYLSFNVFFLFAARPNLKILPSYVEMLFSSFYIIISTLWFQRNLNRSQPIYQRESLSGSLRRQLQKLAVNWSDFLEGRSMAELNSQEVYILAKVLPNFNRQSRLQVYQGVLKEALAAGQTQSATSLELLQGMRKELQVTVDEHYSVLANLGVENPGLLDPVVQRSQEDRLRLASYQRHLETLLLDLIASRSSIAKGASGAIEQALQQKQGQIELLRQEYSISSPEQEQVLLDLFHPNSALLSTSVQLLTNLQLWSARYQTMQDNVPNLHGSVSKILRSIMIEKQRSIITQLFNILEILATDQNAIDIATTTGYLAPTIVPEMIKIDANRFTPQVYKSLLNESYIKRPTMPEATNSLAWTVDSAHITEINNIRQKSLPMLTILEVMQDLLTEVDPLVQTLSLYVINQIDASQGKVQANKLNGFTQPLVQETIDRILQKPVTLCQAPSLVLDLVVGTRHERREFTQLIVTLGRAPENDLIILDNQISRNHAIFKIDANGIILRDLGSTNGLRFGNSCLKDTEQALPTGTKVMLCPSNEITVTAHRSMVELPAETVTILEKLLWFRGSRFFEPFGHQSLVDLAQSSSLRVYQQGEMLCEEGVIADALMLLVSGTAKIGQEKLGPGRVVGELGILTKSTYQDTVTAYSANVPALIIPSDSFNDLLDRDAQVARALLVSVSERLRA
jgi:FHA domain/Cyclic nucleotide-binding domain/4Fe-4S binding domain